MPIARPDLIVFPAGADPWEGDRLGRLALTKKDLRHRDVLVVDRANSLGVPLCTTLEGVYATDVRDTVEKPGHGASGGGAGERDYNRSQGAIAQLEERLLCKQEVTGSIPVGSTATCSPPLQAATRMSRAGRTAPASAGPTARACGL